MATFVPQASESTDWMMRGALVNATMRRRFFDKGGFCMLSHQKPVQQQLGRKRMVKTRVMGGLALVWLFSACTQLPPKTLAVGGSNCDVGQTGCLLTVLYEKFIFFPPKFTMSVEPAFPPINQQADIHVYWRLPDGFRFDPTKGDGPQLQNFPAFTDPYVTDALYHKSTVPGPGFHWTIPKAQSFPTQYYWLHFQGPGPGARTGQWKCDPTIASFGQAPTPADPPAMKCDFTPG